MLKDLKKRGRKSLKKHYLLFVFVCFLAAFIGSEFVNSAALTKGTGAELENSNYLTDIYTYGVNGAEKHINNNLENLKKYAGSDVFDRSRGVFAMVINTLSSGKLYLNITQGVISAVHSEKLGIIILIVLSLLLSFFIFAFIENVYIVIARRIFLEGRVYDKVQTQRFVFLVKIRKWANVAIAMFLVSLFKTLWMLTIVGGFVKKYSYYLVPYIMAENPDIKPFKAIKLSRDMMNGNKWRCFLYEISFIGWDILSFISAGTTAVFYSNPYKIATFTEFYVVMRDRAKENNINLSEKLNDKYLYEKASKVILEEKYSDVWKEVNLTEKDFTSEKKGIRNFLNRYLGITLFGEKYNDIYEKEQLRKMKQEKYKYILSGKMYPDRLFTIDGRKRKNRFETLNYLRSYSIITLIVLFFVLSTIGWVYEVSIHLVRDGAFVNRGTMHGPWLPIYGWGGILILTVLYNFRHSPKMQFFATIVLCGVIEYFTSFVLENVYGQRWWDYTGYFINLHGRICSEGLLIFGLGGLVISYVLAPIVDNFVKKLDKKVVVSVITVLVAIFMIDQIYSIKMPNIGKGITSYSYVDDSYVIAMLKL